MKRNTLTAAVIALICVMMYSCQKNEQRNSPTPDGPTSNIVPGGISIPLGGNAYITEPVEGGTEAISSTGLVNWSSPEAIASTFFRLGQTGSLDVYIEAAVPTGNSINTIKVTVNGTPFNVNISGQVLKTYRVGTVNITNLGYAKVDFAGVNKGSNPYFANVSNVIISGPASGPNLIYANDPANFSLSRKGAILQLNYNVPSEVNAEWFYNELTVPPNGFRIGTTYISNGFIGGEIGLQVNSPTDRKIVFTVNDNLNQQPVIVRTGINVSSNLLNGDIKGGQSVLDYNWSSGITYKFLTQGKPDGFGSTVFSSWFYAAETSEWKFIASWKRTGTSDYLKNIYSTLEGTNTENSFTVRKARYYNQWVRDNNGNWIEIKEAYFGGNSTAANMQRFDYAGGVEYSSFYMKSNGFFPENVAIKTNFTRSGTVASPNIDFDNLP